MLRANGVKIRQTGVQSPFQLGLGERHGGLIKEVVSRAIHSFALKLAGPTIPRLTTPGFACTMGAGTNPRRCDLSHQPQLS